MHFTNPNRFAQVNVDDVVVYCEPLPPLTWGEVLRMEPKLIGLMSEARRARRRADWRTYEDYKRRVSALVGWNCHRPELQSERAYELAIGRLTEALGL